MEFKFFSKAQAYPWIRNRNISFRGYFLWRNFLYTKENAIDLLASYNTVDKFILLLKELNGSFSICIEFEQQLVIAVDRQRTLPVFYAIEKDCLYVSESASLIMNELEIKTINQTSVEEFKSTTLFVTGKDTLIEEISQVCAGNMLIVDRNNSDCIQKEYFSYQWGNYYEESKEQLKQKFDTTYKKVGEDMIKVLNGRTAVIPLSGGYDSRMILEQLIHGGYKKIICYTYGDSKNQECVLSKQVAAKYGVEWHIVPYTYSLMKSFYKSDIFKEYFLKEGNLVSLPHIQDLIALLELKRQGVLPKDSVFIPGHSGDAMEGNHIPEIFKEYDRVFSKKDCINCIMLRHYQNNKVSSDVRIKLDKMIDEKPYTAEEGAAIVERFNYNERQAKFIINTVRAYEFLGFEWLLPLWNNEMFEFWSHIPIKLRYGRALYYSCVNRDKDISYTTKENNILAKLRGVTNKIYPIRVLGKMLLEFLYYFKNPFCFKIIIPFFNYFVLVCSHSNAIIVPHIWFVQYMVIPNLKNQVKLSKKV